LDVLPHSTVKFMLPASRNRERADFPATLDHSGSDGLVFRPGPSK
jgi:hypothetical protein